ncbi:hypothetical protein G7047_04580 [Diaphorobacter sp. HDW4A]|uniref:hypothetical protein n=1 Tax=Diaphorobacter sp. HDW4A TaxID=2714924 RepID=UPI0014084065|nr:hypothetical protein [Diaphorobacter sp. HDW4A]QIL79260.1 hypothetical protein G7047_04580 [Diaphorobacter sp. HDW4A]
MSTQSRTTELSTSALLAEWRRLTHAGNDARQAQCVVHAFSWHEQALRVAHRLLFKHTDSIDVPDDDRLAAFVVAHLNLAECLETLDQPSSAAECLQCAHNRLKSIMENEDESQSMRIAACHHIRYTWAALNEHETRRSGTPNTVDALLPTGLHWSTAQSTSLH